MFKGILIILGFFLVSFWAVSEFRPEQKITIFEYPFIGATQQQEKQPIDLDVRINLDLCKEPPYYLNQQKTNAQKRRCY